MFGKKNTIVIHGVPVSVHVRKALAVATIKAIPFENPPVIPFQPPAHWRDLSPTGLIPAMEDGDFVCADSLAMCLYFERKQPKPALVPQSDTAFAKTIALDSYAGGTLYRHVVHPLFFQRVIRPNMLGETTDQDAIDKVFAETAPPILAYLDSITNRDFVVGDSLTIADLALVSNFINFMYLGYRIDAGKYPRLADYVQRHLRREPIRTLVEKEKPFAEQMGLDRAFLEKAFA